MKASLAIVDMHTQHIALSKGQLGTDLTYSAFKSLESLLEDVFHHSTESPCKRSE